MNKIKALWQCGWGLYKKYEEILSYLIFGFFGVIVSVASYAAARWVGCDILASNVISWVVAVIFVYFTNRIFVFKSRSKGRDQLAEFIEFVGARFFTLFVETGVLFLCAQVIGINDVVSKVIAQIVIIIMNYILSKFWIFKKGEEIGKKESSKKRQ